MASATLNIATLAPVPHAIDRTAMAVSARLRANTRAPCLTSCQRRSRCKRAPMNNTTFGRSDTVRNARPKLRSAPRACTSRRDTLRSSYPSGSMMRLLRSGWGSVRATANGWLMAALSGA